MFAILRKLIVSHPPNSGPTSATRCFAPRRARPLGDVDHAVEALLVGREHQDEDVRELRGADAADVGDAGSAVEQHAHAPFFCRGSSVHVVSNLKKPKSSETVLSAIARASQAKSERSCGRGAVRRRPPSLYSANVTSCPRSSSRPLP
jgi:hypothetical protein